MLIRNYFRLKTHQWELLVNLSSKLEKLFLSRKELQIKIRELVPNPAGGET